MNELVKSYLSRIEKSVHDLHEALRQSHEQLQTQQEAHERLLKQYWSRGKEVSTLSEAMKNFEALQNENQRLKEAHKELQERTRRVLEYTKALTDEFRR